MTERQSTWKPSKLGDYVDVQTGFPFKSQRYVDDPSGVRLLRGDNIIQGRLRWDGVKRWPKIEASDFGKYALQADDVVLAMDRPWIEAGLKYAWITERDLPCLLVQRVSRLRGRNGLLTPYIRYVIGHDSFTDYVKGIWTGVAVPHISESQIRAFDFLLPPIATQQKIVKVLSAYDNLVENNTRRIKILEDIAQMIYREWFVNFHFPGHEKVRMVDSELGRIPSIWQIEPLENVCSKLGSGGTPSRGVSEYWHPPTIKWFKTKELVDGFLFNSEEGISEQGYKESSAKLFPPDTIVMAIYAAPTVGRLGILTNESTFNQAACGLLADPQRICVSFLYHQLIEMRAYFNRISQGAAQPNISVEKVRKAPALVPSLDLIRQFDAIVHPAMRLVRTLSEKNANLRTTRDLLLPKLISGEIPVEAAEHTAAELMEATA